MFLDLLLNGIVKVTEPFVYKGGSSTGIGSTLPPINPPPREESTMSKIEVVTGPKTAQTLQELRVEMKIIVKDALNQIAVLSPGSPRVVDTLILRHWPDATLALDEMRTVRERTSNG